MTFDDARKLIDDSTDSQLNESIEKSAFILRMLFFTADGSAKTRSRVADLFSLLISRHINNEAVEAQAFQSFLGHFAIYFKKFGMTGMLNTVRQFLRDENLLNRIRAYVQTRDYNSVNDYFDRLEEYLDLLSSAVDSGETDNLHDIVDDIVEYHGFVIRMLNRLNLGSRAQHFTKFLLNDERNDRYPFISLVSDKINYVFAGLEIKDSQENIFTLSADVERIFNDHITAPVKNHPLTEWPKKPLGNTWDYNIEVILERGLANFDEPKNGVEPSCRVLLYCFYNMRMHFFTSKFLFEKIPGLIDLYRGAGRIKFVDFGAGPATSGLAFVDFINLNADQPIILDYIGVDSSKAMRSQAEIMFGASQIDTRSVFTYVESFDSIKMSSFEDSSCILFNASYFFASKSLEVGPVASFVQSVRDLDLTIPIYFLYQNALGVEKNEKYIAFKNSLGDLNVLFHNSEKVFYSTNRRALDSPSSVTTLFEIIEM